MNRFAPQARVARPRPFSWSYSKLKNFETCQRRYERIDVTKQFPEPESPQLIEGNQVHDALARAVTGAARLETLYEGKYVKYQPWVDKLTSKGNDTIIVEQKLAIHENKTPAEFRGAAWFRGVVDYMKVVGRVAMLVDYKTGKRAEDSVQLALSAALVFAHYPHILKVRTEFIWLKDDSPEPTSREDFDRHDMHDLWVSLKPRIEALQYAYENNIYVPMKGYLCKKYCGVANCEYYQR